jgi:hypothetical protein
MNMQWSKLKRNIESLFADCVKGRVGLHSTRYRTMHDHDGRAWITLDGKEIVNMVHIWKWLSEVNKRAASLAGLPDMDSFDLYLQGHKYDHKKQEAERELEDESFFTQSHLGGAMHEYQNLSIDNILASENHVIRAIGMLDRRLGKRRLKSIDIKSEHPLVKTTYLFRVQAEGIINEKHPISC